MNNSKLNKLLKILFVIILVLYIISNKKTTNVSKFKGCLNDKFFDFTYKLNMILKTNNFIRNFMLILSSGILDLSLIAISYSWITSGRNWRLIMSITLYLIVRELCNLIFEIRQDEDLIWSYPGFPSLTVSYHNRKDFFFCGTIGLYLISILELIEYQYKKFKWVAIIGINIHFWLLLSLRAQYYFSILFGLLSAHYIHIISDQYKSLLNELYDFDPDETARLNQLKVQENIKNIIENSIKKFETQKIVKYDQVPNQIELSAEIDHDNYI